jgi:hypothetical protein
MLKIGADQNDNNEEIEGFEDLPKNLLQTIGGNNLFKRVETVC